MAQVNVEKKVGKAKAAAERKKPAPRGLAFDHQFARRGVDPLDEITWERRTSVITNPDGSIVFKCEGADIPSGWSQLATDIVASKYFRRAGLHGKKEVGETSVRQVVHRIARTIREAGEKFGGYFAATKDADAFEADLSYLLVNQVGAFNSPVWFNCGLFHRYGITGTGGNFAWDQTKKPGDAGEIVETDSAYERPQCSACFIQSANDDLMSIYDLIKSEARLFKYGSGSGTNFSAIRGRQEKLSGGGTSSGLMSFLEVFDRAAGATKSGGTCLAPHQRVYTANGPIAVKELAEAGTPFVALSYDPPAGRYKAKAATAWAAGHKMVVRVVTDKGAFEVTDDHPVKLSTGEYVKAGDIKAGMSLFACSVDTQHGHLRVHLRNGRKGKEFLHRMVAADVMGASIDGIAVHHRDGNRLNNDPKNLEPMPQSDHAAEHGRERAAAGTHIFQTEAFPHAGAANGMHSEGAFWKDPVRSAQYRETQGEVLAASGRAPTMQDMAADQRMINTAFRVLNAGHVIDTFEQYAAGRRKAIGPIGSLRKLRKQIDHRFGSYQSFVSSVAAANHRVASVEPVGRMDVYDVEVQCPTADDKSPSTGHNFVIWPDGDHVGSGVVVANTRRAAKMVCLDMDHPEIVDFINWKVREEKKAHALIAAGYSSDFNGDAYRTVGGQNSNNSVRVSDAFMRAAAADGPWATISRTTGDVVETLSAKDLWRQVAEAAWHCADPGVQFDTTINDWHTVPNSGRINASNPCSEYMHLDDSACNLASLNLTKFLREDGSFDVDGYRHAIRVFFVAQEILVDFSAYPTKQIAKNSHDYRPLGLGYANLGTLLMLLGLPYDSDAGRSMASALTAILTGHAYKVSAEMAATKGPFNGFAKNRAPMLRVMGMHRDAADALDRDNCPAALYHAACADWDQAIALGTEHGYRNAQATVLAPTGTIGLLMDCDTTGIEPDFSLVKFKKLAGGGYFKIVNQSVPEALRRLCYTATQVQEIVAYVQGTNTLLAAPHINRATLKTKGLTVADIAKAEAALPGVFALDLAFGPWVLGEETYDRLGVSKTGGGAGLALLKHLGFTAAEIEQAGEVIIGRMTVEGAPHLREDHYAVFDCANRCGKTGKRFLAPMAHVRMMAAAQPFLSGAISKTVNLPNEATVEDVQKIYEEGWRLGIKAVALYRDGCKASQPLSSTSDSAKAEKATPPARGTAETTASTQVASLAPRSPTEARRMGRRDTRIKLQKNRRGFTQEAKIGGHKVYLRTGEYADGTLGEIFVDLHKDGAAFRSVMNCFAIAVSVGLQYGVPLEDFVRRFTFTRFEPQGVVEGHANIKLSTSIIDYLFRALGVAYLDRFDLVQIAPEASPATCGPADAHAPPAALPPARTTDANQGDAPVCDTCGHLTVRNAACYRCLNCGASMGCS